MFFPYDARLLRCHPVGHLYRGNTEAFHGLLCSNWRIKCEWKCSECDNEYNASNNCDFFLKKTQLILVFNQCHQTCKCSIHVRSLIGRSRNRYIGPFIPLEISRPIRAGILYGVDFVDLQSLVESLLIPSYPIPVRDSIQEREVRARIYIAVLSGFTHPELADNCFWGDAIVTNNKNRTSKRIREHPGLHKATYKRCYAFYFAYTGGEFGGRSSV
jgi:hypothetical protein